ncbi:hypothetical protein [Myxococcus sp. Y35]|uniref:hypothetical protein n=1 Tax=Pseudomyxococcus flavus TaxID=3115648 RepID=UPI003CF92D3B
MSGAAPAVPPLHGPDGPPIARDVRMIALKVQGAQGESGLRLESGRDVHLRWPTWKGTLRVLAMHDGQGTYEVSVWLPGKDAPVKRAVLKKKGAAVTLVPGKDVPEGYFGTAERPVKFILDE